MRRPSSRLFSSGQSLTASTATHSGRQVSTAASKLSSPAKLRRSLYGNEAILLQRFEGHSAAVISTLVSSDTEHGKEFITCSLDKSVVLWSLPVSADNGGQLSNAAIERVRMCPKGAPVFSLAAESPSVGSTRRQVFCGTAAKSVSTWELPAQSFADKARLNGHTGWVRALATDGRWLYSSGCNHISQWDLSRSVPRKICELSLFTGDVQGLAAGCGRLFSCGADGSVRCWSVGRRGELAPLAAREKAHKERVSAIALAGGCLYSTGADGSIKMWDANSLELVEVVEGAHGGGKVHCAAIGADGNLYTGGEDKLVRRWQLGTLARFGEGALYAHNYAVRSLAAGALETLVSADSSGEIAIWKI